MIVGDKPIRYDPTTILYEIIIKNNDAGNDGRVPGDSVVYHYIPRNKSLTAIYAKANPESTFPIEIPFINVEDSNITNLKRVFGAYPVDGDYVKTHKRG